MDRDPGRPSSPERYNQEITDALAASDQKHAPPIDTLFDDVYEELPWNLREQRAYLAAQTRTKNPHHHGPDAITMMNLLESVRDALRTQMRVDPRVVVLGEDVGKFGGVFRATSGLFDEFGGDRVIDTPLAEAGIIGTAIGMALYGLRPVPEIQFSDFIFPAFDQIVNELAKFRYRSGGQYPCPVVIRTPVGGGIRGGHYHSQSRGRGAVSSTRPASRS